MANVTQIEPRYIALYATSYRPDAVTLSADTGGQVSISFEISAQTAEAFARALLEVAQAARESAEVPA